MSDFATATFLSGLGITLGMALVVFLAAWVISRRLGRVNVVDTAWGLSFVAITLAAYLWSAHASADGLRRDLVLAMTTAWGLRLSAYIGWRSRGHGEDPRYAAMLTRASGSPSLYALRTIFTVQAAIAWFVSLPIQASMVERSSVGVLGGLGVAVFAVGVFFETAGDAQLAAFKRDPANAGKVMDRGLWRYTRHPNYFGDACVWTGIYLVAAQQWQGALTILSPLAMGWFLAAKTGKPLMERSLSQSKPGYADYVERTSGFFPLPPKEHAGPGRQT